MKLSVVIPVYNEKDTIKQLILNVKNSVSVEKEIVIVDDASKDGTVDILRQMLIEDPTIKMYFKQKNAGKGAALREGFKHTTGDYVIVQDADLEYDPKDYAVLINALYNQNAQVVYGSRFSGNYKDMTNLHYIGNKFLTWFTNLLFGTNLTDMETCYKLLPGDFVRKLIIRSERFNFEPEITAKILKSGLKITEVPISYKGRSHSEGKKITWRDGISAIATLVKYKFVN